MEVSVQIASSGEISYVTENVAVGSQDRQRRIRQCEVMLGMFRKSVSISRIHRCHRSSRAHAAGVVALLRFLSSASVPVFTTFISGTFTSCSRELPTLTDLYFVTLPLL
eukprot:4137242-Pleurochrysis_carterae.AAC.1